MTPVVRVVGLGPAGVEMMTVRARRLLLEAPVARLRTRRHPAADAFPDVESYDDLYERARSFDELYDAIVADLVELARGSSSGEVVYAVPGSALVAERTVVLLRERDDLTVVVEPAVSVIDLACAARGVDPMAVQLRVIDALAPGERVRGPGPLLVLQTYAPEVLAAFADRLDPETSVTVLHHLGQGDEVVTTLTARRLATFAADHLTSLWIDEVRGPGESLDELVSITRRLRRECPWDREQTHESLTRHLLEESYEAIEALDDLAADPSEATRSHVAEELGDVLFQVVLHAELGDEEDAFDLTSIIDGLCAKLIARHPHVFGGVDVVDAEDVARRWEVLKSAEKGRTSAVDGVTWRLPALTLYDQILDAASRAGVVSADATSVRDAARGSLEALSSREGSSDADVGWGDLLDAVARLAHESGVDLEGALRARARALAHDVREHESESNGGSTGQG